MQSAKYHFIEKFPPLSKTIEAFYDLPVREALQSLQASTVS